MTTRQSEKSGERRIVFVPHYTHVCIRYFGHVEKAVIVVCGRVSCVHDQRGEVVAHPSLAG